MEKIDFKKEINHLMEEYLSDFSLKVLHDKGSRTYYVNFVNLKTNRTISLTVNSYSELYYHLVFFEFGYDYKRI